MEKQQPTYEIEMIDFAIYTIAKRLELPRHYFSRGDLEEIIDDLLDLRNEIKKEGEEE